jgi:N-acetylmuramoyl-L-alanine amidase
MDYTKDKVIAVSILMVMVCLVSMWLIGTAISLYLAFNEVSEPEEETYIVVMRKEHTKEVIKTVEVKTVHTQPKEDPKKEIKTIDDNTYLLAQIIHAEAKGEPYNGKLAVGNVIMNRVNHSSFPDTIKGVIFQKGQFSPVSDGSINNKPNEESIKAAKEVISGKKIVGNQAVYFYNPNTSTSNWIFTREVVTKIGNHAFAI